MQKLLYAQSNGLTTKGITNEVNEYLSDGWKVVMICPAGTCAAFVVIEKNDDDDD